MLYSCYQYGNSGRQSDNGTSRCGTDVELDRVRGVGVVVVYVILLCLAADDT